MTRPDLARLLMVCGALNDLSEKCLDMFSRPQIKEVQAIVEKIAVKYMEPKDKKIIEVKPE